ncbi:nucleotide kinase [Enterococcus phage vB_Efs22_KEN09]
MILQDGMVVKRKDNGLKGVAHKMEGKMWKVKYHDGTHTYTTESAFKNHFVIPELEVNFEDSKCDGVEPEQEEVMTYDEYLYMSGGVEPDVEVYFESDLIDNQIHYTVNGIQPIQIMKANMTKEEFRGFLEGNILKYPLRYKHKNGLEDLKKAKTYLTWLIEDIEERGL